MIGAKAQRIDKSKAVVVFALLLVILMAVSLLMAKSAQAVATFTVNSAADPGTGGCNATECTLREAITAANTNAGADTINFAIPGDGPHIISPSVNLPAIAEAVTIDGYTQGDTTATTTDDAEENTIPLAKDGTNAVIKIEINGAVITGATSLLRVGSGASDVVIRGLALNGRNISGSSGLEIDGGLAVIEGNFIGTNAAGTTAVPNQNGVFVDDGSNVTIGGDAPGERNLISGNTFGGVTVNSSDNTIEGNIIGLDKNGDALGNGSQGVRIQGAPPGTGNSILDNSISSNDQGILLSGIDANDPKDPDTGPNNGQNFPVLSSAVRSSDGATTIQGKLNSTPRKVFTIQFFSNPSADPEEGKKFLGELNVRTGRKGTVSFKFITTEDVAADEAVTATATAFSTGDTSEFSAAEPVVQGA
jgi:CSLREA domain-containing protein